MAPSGGNNKNGHLRDPLLSLFSEDARAGLLRPFQVSLSLRIWLPTPFQADCRLPRRCCDSRGEERAKGILMQVGVRTRCRDEEAPPRDVQRARIRLLLQQDGGLLHA